MKALSRLLVASIVTAFAIATGRTAATTPLLSHDSSGRPALGTVAVVVSPVAAIASVNQLLGAPHSIFQSGFE